MLSIGSVQAVYKWTEGKSIPEIGTLCGLSKILDVSIEVLLEPDYHMERKEERSGLRKADRIRFFQTAVLLFRRMSIRIILSEC